MLREDSLCKNIIRVNCRRTCRGIQEKLVKLSDHMSDPSEATPSEAGQEGKSGGSLLTTYCVGALGDDTIVYLRTPCLPGNTCLCISAPKVMVWEEL